MEPSREQRADRLARKVIDLAQAQVIARNHFLSAAVGRLRPKPALLAAPLATDGYTLSYDAGKVIARFKREGEAPERDLVHSVAHCLFLHPYVGPSVDRGLWDLACDMAAERAVIDLCGPRGGERGAQIAQAIGTAERDLGKRVTAERAYRQLREGRWRQREEAWKALFSCDDHAGWYPDRESPQREGAAGSGRAAGKAAVRARQGGGGDDATGTGDARGAFEGAGDGAPPNAAAAGEDGPARGHAAAGGRGQLGDGSGEGGGGRDGGAPQQRGGATSDSPIRRGGAPAQPAGRASAGAAGKRPGGSERRVRAESAAAGLRDLPAPSRRQLEGEWREVARALAVDLQTASARSGRGLGGLVEVLGDAARPRADYARFLRRFATPGVVTRLSEDEFDASFYTYGMSLYGNMPLIEPLEQREERRVREFVVVIDTSGSVYRDEVKRFVEATFALLKETESFFSQVNLRILQCDAQVRTDDKITCTAELAQWGESMTVVGGGGTDFRPAFAYIDALVDSGEFRELGGVVYFTDGQGTYPERMPAYQVAFVYGGAAGPMPDAPPWAVQIALDSDTM